MKVLVTFAVEPEFAPWRKLRPLREIEVGGVPVSRTEIGAATVDFVVTGMGVDNAQRVANLVMTEDYTMGIASGFAGALRPEHRVGSILVAEAVRQIGKAKTVHSSRRLALAASSDGAFPAKMFLTSEAVVRTAADKAKLAPLADAVDMESFAILSAAEEHRISSVAIRVISDTSQTDVPVFLDTMVDDTGRVKIGAAIRNVVGHPIHLPALLRLGRDSRTAAETLARFLEVYIQKLSLKTSGWFVQGEGLEEVTAR